MELWINYPERASPDTSMNLLVPTLHFHIFDITPSETDATQK